MEMITQLLNEIVKSLQQLDHSCLDHLNPGISSQQIQELFEEIPFSQLRTCVPFILGETDQKIVRESHSVSWHFFLVSI